MISAREYYEPYTVEEIENGEVPTYEEFLEEYGDYLYHLQRDNNWED